MQESEDIRATRESMAKLPAYCFAPHPVSHRAVKIERGVAGYASLDTLADPDELNASLNISKAQAAAMLAGSMFGWHTRAADPANYTEDGRPVLADKKPSHRQRRGDRCTKCGGLMPNPAAHRCP
jgi:hypothetical protein